MIGKLRPAGLFSRTAHSAENRQPAQFPTGVGAGTAPPLPRAGPSFELSCIHSATGVPNATPRRQRLQPSNGLPGVPCHHRLLFHFPASHNFRRGDGTTFPEKTCKGTFRFRLSIFRPRGRTAVRRIPELGHAKLNPFKISFLEGPHPDGRTFPRPSRNSCNSTEWGMRVVPHGSFLDHL